MINQHGFPTVANLKLRANYVVLYLLYFFNIENKISNKYSFK